MSQNQQLKAKRQARDRKRSIERRVRAWQKAHPHKRARRRINLPRRSTQIDKDREHVVSLLAEGAVAKAKVERQAGRKYDDGHPNRFSK